MPLYILDCPKLKRLTTSNAGQDSEELELLGAADEN